MKKALSILLSLAAGGLANAQQITISSHKAHAAPTVTPLLITLAGTGASIPVVTEGTTCDSASDQAGVSAGNLLILTCQSNVWSQQKLSAGVPSVCRTYSPGGMTSWGATITSISGLYRSDGYINSAGRFNGMLACQTSCSVGCSSGGCLTTSVYNMPIASTQPCP